MMGGKYRIGPPPADDDEEGGSEEQDSSDSPSLSGQAAKRVLRAIESGDAGALDKALKAHYEACSEAE